MNKNSLIPLNRVVNAAIVDMHEDIGKVKQTYTHWAAREFKLLDRQILKTRKKRPVLLHVNASTRTATLPPDFEEELFVGIISNQGLKVPIRSNNYISDTKAIEDIDCIDKCPKCNANMAICEDLAITETTTIVTINSANYEQTVVKKLYPNGDYYLETTIPVLDISTNTVSYRTSKEFVAHIDLKPCGCVEETDANLATLQICNPDVYCSYYAGCDNSCNINYGGYKIFEETGLIQFDYNFPFNQVYMEYNGFLPKINGQFYVPSVAFETVVEGTKFRSVKNKSNVGRLETREYERYYVIAKEDMTRVLGRTSLARILNVLDSTPKFDIFIDTYNPYCATAPTVASSVSTVCDNTATSSSNTTIIQNSGTTYVPFTLGKIVSGVDAGGSQTVQYDELITALNLTVLIVNDTTYTVTKGDFTFDNVTGIISLTLPNKFFNGDVLVAPYFKIL